MSIPKQRLLLAGDIGGTKTLLGLFDSSPSRPRSRTVRTFATLEYDDLLSIIAEFVDAEAVAPSAIEAACFGVAGPVIDEAAELTNRSEERRVGKECSGRAE